MMNHTRKSQHAHFNPFLPGLAVTVMLAFAIVAGPVSAVEKGSFKIPSMKGYTLISEEKADGDGDGVKETRVKHYINSNGDMLFSMTTKDILWAWSSQSQGGAEAEKNYVIRDSDCDGVFNERYTLDDEYHVPDCLK